MKDRIYKDKPERNIFDDSDLFGDNENYEDDEDEDENPIYESEYDDDYELMSDSELIRFAEDSALEELIVMDGEGGLANRDEIIQALIDQDMNLAEAKKDEDEDAPVADDEEIDFSTDEVVVDEDPLKTAAAGATGDSKELINHLMTALDAAKAMSNEKLTTQILNTLKFAIDQSMGEN